MGTLDAAVRVATGWPPGRRAARDALLRHLEGVHQGYVEARSIWQEYIDTRPRAPLSGSRWTVLNWIGQERAQRLWTVNRRINEHIARISELTGADLPWSFPTDEVMIDAADRELVNHPDQGGVHSAQVAIDRVEERIEHVRALRNELSP